MSQAITFKFTVDGEKQIKRGLSRFGEFSGDLREPFWNMVKDFGKIERAQFASEGRRGGGKWKKLDTKYAARKEWQWGIQPIMVASGHLRESLGGSGSDAIKEVHKLDMTVGASSDFAIFHHRGGRNPKRKLIELTNADKKRWTDFIQKYLVYLSRNFIRGKI